MKLTPDNYEAPGEPTEPTEAEIDANKAEIKARAEAIARAAKKPIHYEDIVREMQKDGFHKFLVNPKDIIEEVDRAWNPEKFEAQAEPFGGSVEPKGDPK